jgi:hypothetical protein
MGVLYTVIPLNTAHEDFLPWLDELGVEYPTNEEGRNPTPQEVRAALAELRDYTCDFSGGTVGTFWQVDISWAAAPEDGPWTALRTLKYEGENDPIEIYFEKGWREAVLSVLTNLCRTTGPLVLIPDTGEKPIVVTANRTIEETLAVWDDADEE